MVFDPTPEIFATDSSGAFFLPLTVNGRGTIRTGEYDEIRFVVSVWHPSQDVHIDLDRAYLEMRTRFDPSDDHWTKLAEIEPVVPAYGSGESFDGWIVLPVLAEVSHFAIFGSGFAPRRRIQVRSSGYFVP